MPEVTKKVAKALELLGDYVDMGADALINLEKMESALKLLQEALDKLCEEAK